MFDYKLSEEDAERELAVLLEDAELNDDYTKLADVGICYYVLGNNELASDFFWKSYNLQPNKYAAANLSRIYIKTENLDELKKAYLRFAEDKAEIYPSDGLKLFAKYNYGDVIKELASFNWGPIISYVKSLYKLGEYSFCVEMIESRYQFNKYFLMDKAVEVFYYWLLCKIQLNKYDDIEKIFNDMPLNAKKNAIHKIALAGMQADNTDIFINVLEDLYAETDYTSNDIRMYLMKLYDKNGYDDDKISLAKKVIMGQKNRIDKVFVQLISALYALDATEDIETLNKLYGHFKVELDKIVEKNS